MLKVAVLGGGSTYTPELVNDFLARLNQFPNILGTQPGLAMAASMMTIALPVVIFFFAQRAFMRGVVITGVEK